MVGLNIITVIYYFTNNRNGLRNGQILFSKHQNGSEKKKENHLSAVYKKDIERKLKFFANIRQITSITLYYCSPPPHTHVCNDRVALSERDNIIVIYYLCACEMV